MRLRITISILFISLPLSLLSQPEQPQQNEKAVTNNLTPVNKKEYDNLTWHQMFTNIPEDYYLLGRSYTDFSNIGSLLGVLAVSGLSSISDHNLWQSTKTFSQQNPFIDNAKDKILFIGDGKLSLITAGLFSLYGWLSNNKQHLKTSSNLVEALLTTGILVQLLKRTFGRESPSVATLKRGRWDLFPSFSEYNKNQPRYYSFPSGHIATLTTTVVVLANNYPDEKWIRPVGYTAIGLVGTSLVAKGWHWYSDLPLGIYLGYTIGNIIAPSENENQIVKNKVTRSSIFPLVYNNCVSLNYTMQF
jgi:membrane-associated phospholipid phosphatase